MTFPHEPMDTHPIRQMLQQVFDMPLREQMSRLCNDYDDALVIIQTQREYIEQLRGHLSVIHEEVTTWENEELT